MPRAVLLPNADEPLPVLLMNTVWADTAGPHDALSTPAELDAWLGALATQLPVMAAAGRRTRTSETELARFRRLRDALRDVAAELSNDPRRTVARRDLARAVDAVNEAAGAAPSWPQLSLSPRAAHPAVPAGTRPAAAALSAIAVQAVELFTSADPALPRVPCPRVRSLLRQGPSAPRMVLGRVWEPRPRRTALPAAPVGGAIRTAAHRAVNTEAGWMRAACVPERPGGPADGDRRRPGQFQTLRYRPSRSERRCVDNIALRLDCPVRSARRRRPRWFVRGGGFTRRWLSGVDGASQLGRRLSEHLPAGGGEVAVAGKPVFGGNG